MNIDGDAFRQFMRRVPVAVTVVTASNGKEMRGATIGSFTSVSLAPPLICFNVMRTSRTHLILSAAESYAVHLLSKDQVELSHHFAVPDMMEEEQFENVPHRIDADGIPLLKNTLGILFCRGYAVYEAGDHSIFIGEVTGVEEGVPGEPLLYFARAYHGLGAEVDEEESTSDGSNGSPLDPAPKKAKS